MTIMGNDLISVIVPVYNSADGVVRCLKSVCAQDYTNLEIIIVYKHSTDNSLELIKSVHDSRIKIIEQTENSGPGGARNIGIDNATGDWLGFVEADDYIAPDFYSKLLNVAIKYGCDIAQGQIVSGNRCTTYKKIIAKTYYQKLRQLKNGASFDKLFKTEFIKKHNIRFMESVQWEDNPFIFRALYYGNVATDVSAKYFYNPEPWQDEYKNKLKHDILPVCKEILTFFNSVKLTYAEKTLAYKKVIFQCVAGSFIDDIAIYNGLMDLFGNPLFLRVRHYRRILKQKLKKDKK